MTKEKIGRMTDLNVKRVSVVDTPANRRDWVLEKKKEDTQKEKSMAKEKEPDKGELIKVLKSTISGLQKIKGDKRFKAPGSVLANLPGLQESLVKLLKALRSALQAANHKPPEEDKLKGRPKRKPRLCLNI